MSLEDVPTRLSWHSLWCFAHHLGPDSATYAAMYPKYAGWSRTEYMIADLYDAVNGVAYAVASTIPRSYPRKPKPYKRPSGRGQKFGRDPIKVADFDAWWKERAHHGRK